MRKLFVILSLLVIGAGCKKDTPEISDADQLIKDDATIDAWLATNNITALTDPSGLRYVITTTGTGVKPKLTSGIKVKYIGKLFNGTIFDQGTIQPSLSCTCRVQDFIKGWQVGLPLLPAGTKATFYIPSGLAYGKPGYATIPSNANLIFDIELIQVY